MKFFSFFGKKLEQIRKYSCFRQSTRFHLYGTHFYLELFYFLLISSFGFLIIRLSDSRTTTFTPRNLDLFFTSVSASTVSSMSVVEMEVFSNTQLVVLTILMFMGGEVFISMVAFNFRRIFRKRSLKKGNKVDSLSNYIDIPSNFPEKINTEFESSKSGVFCVERGSTTDVDTEQLKYKSIDFLGNLVLGYLLFVQAFGVVLVLIYMNVINSAKSVLHQKGLKALTFSLFTIASTFANCGFVPTNENMISFRKNSGLLLILIPQVLLGNTLYPLCLRFSIWVIGKLTKKAEARYLLKNSQVIGYHHLFSHLRSFLLVITVLVFIVLQFLLFSLMEWNSSSLRGLNFYEKVVGILFQTVNTRHTGESVVDLSTTAAAVLVLFVFMMYLPPYTSFLPVTQKSSTEQGSTKIGKVVEDIIFSQLSYLVIFVILVCITERKHIDEDPVNFSVLNIVVEVVSAYGNVGLTTGYNCDRRLKLEESCENKWYGFSGKWSDEGKLILIVVMVFGKLKKYNKNGGKAWKLL